MKTKLLLLSFVLFALWNDACAQPQVASPIVSKDINKTLLLRPGEVLNVVGEKASLIIKGWKNDYAEIRITFSAEHPNLAVATREVEYMHYSLSRERHTIELRNAFLLPSFVDRIESKVRVLMVLQVPNAIALTLQNR